MVYAMQEDFLRIGTGVPGLDDMVEGGFPFPSTILLAGNSGCGKTTFCLQFLFEGAKRGEKGLYLTTLSEPTNWMLRFTSRFNFVNKEAIGSDITYFDLGPYLKSKYPPEDRYEMIKRVIEEKIVELMPQRIVIDPITSFGGILKDSYREFLFDLSQSLKNWQAVTLMTGESTFEHPYPMEPAYTADGIIILYNIEHQDGRRRYAEVLKMRGTDHITGKHIVDISSDGVSVQVGFK
ncbi:MAG: ATPase domain-containing protein [Candidatus Thermoplasmatota archaeon]|nr:ATPase domain-containing protein [Candidatus Thermoplasmatota archaeon]